MLTAPVHDFAQIFIEVGAATIGLAILARDASRFSVSSIPLYLLAGLAFGNGGIAPLYFYESQSFGIHTNIE